MISHSTRAYHIEEKQILPNHQFNFRGEHSTLEQSHRVMNGNRDALKTKKFSPRLSNASLETMEEVARRLSSSYEARLHNHQNPETPHLLKAPHTRRLQRRHLLLV